MTKRSVRRTSLAGLAVLLALPLAPGATLAQERAAADKPKYNVLLFISDDLRAEPTPYQARLLQTPNIDRIARQGTRFERAYAQYPLCNPSRVSFLTGRYPTTTGVLDNEVWFRALHPDVVTLPQHFKANGYVTLRAGKIFHGGMDDAGAWTEGGEPVQFAGARRPENRASGPSRATHSDRIVVLEGEGESHGDYRTATRAIEYLEKYRDRPFFLAVGFSKPHSPPTAPRKYFDLYDIGEIPLPPDFNTYPAAPPGFPEVSIRRRNADLFIGRESSPDEAREVIRAYYASTSFMDAQVGRVLDALERLGLRERTIIVFFGDHGYHLGEKGKWSKAYSLYEVGLRVPFVIAVPGGKAQVSTRPVELVDLFPTLIELCGLPPLPGLEGQSLVPLLRDPDAEWNHPARAVTLFEGKLGRSVRTDRWHYAEWDGGEAGAMLFDHTVDPLELQNLADDPAYAEVVQAMKNLLDPLPAVYRAATSGAAAAPPAAR